MIRFISSARLFLILLIIGFLFISAPLKGQLTRSSNVDPLPAGGVWSHINILAVMVEFQRDNDAYTVGPGLMDSVFTKDWGKKILDPLPHNSAYFSNHLLFAKNYFEKISNGKLTVSYTVLPVKIILSQTMRNYAPPVNSTDFTPMGTMLAEVWRKVDSTYPGFNFGQYNLFTVFHAGVGRDISMPGSLGNERDIPSLYLGLGSLQNIFGSSFNGFSVSNGSYQITNSMILPETENRETESFGKKYLTQVTINGLLASNIASFLGLPDLFDTKTGLSAIGRFGLMDGQAIFAYNGCFPPAMSAWEKMYLGWVNAISVDKYALRKINIKSNISASLTDTIIAKIPINENEYFLVENRQRDINNDGAKITVIDSNGMRTLTFKKDTTGFYSYNTDSLYGVIIDVDEFDWALPGSGIAIWHIDNKIISEKIVTNSINADKSRRGIFFEEADGINDIGNQFTTIFGTVVTGEGTEEDLWYSGNPARLYTGIFNNTSRPNTKSNAGTNSYIMMNDFSKNASSMSFSLQYGDDIVKPIFSKDLVLPSAGNKILAGTLDNQLTYIVHCGSAVYLFNQDGSQRKVLPGFSSLQPAILGGALLGFQDSILSVYYNGSTVSTNSGGLITSQPTANPSNNGLMIYAGLSNGKCNVFSFGYQSGTVTQTQQITFSTDQVMQTVLFPSESYALCARGGSSPYFTIGNGHNSSGQIQGKAIDIKAMNAAGNMIFVILAQGNRFVVMNSLSVSKEFSFPDLPAINKFALVDLKKDGNPYILFTAGTELFAYNLQGACSEYFPIMLTNNSVNPSLSIAMDAAGSLPIIYTVSSSGLSALNGLSGLEQAGFPAAIALQATRFTLTNLNNKLCIALLDSINHLQVWQIADHAGTVLTDGDFSRQENTNVNYLHTGSTPSGAFLPKDRTYNYPNPVYGGITNIRFYVNENAKVTVTIFDLSGDKVAELTTVVSGGFENEIPWNTNDIQSGVYLAHILAEGVSGKKETAIIKIAVIK